jgi:hypothetical protein
MSQPHTSKDLTFVRHATRQSTFVPGRKQAHSVFASIVIGLGLGILSYMALLIWSGFSPRVMFTVHRGFPGCSTGLYCPWYFPKAVSALFVLSSEHLIVLASERLKKDSPHFL